MTHLPDYSTTTTKSVKVHFRDQYDNQLRVTEMIHCFTVNLFLGKKPFVLEKQGLGLKGEQFLFQRTQWNPCFRQKIARKWGYQFFAILQLIVSSFSFF